MRTIDEIAARIKAGHDDIFGFEAEVLVPYLPYVAAQPFLKEGVTEAAWDTDRVGHSLDRDTIIAEMRDYMEFAWGKVEDHRGLSAGRSIQKMQAWLWLLADDATYAYADDSDHYAPYGAPILHQICTVYGFPIPTGERMENMIAGRACHAGCRDGCSY